MIVSLKIMKMKRRNCPRCGSPIVWSLNNLLPGGEGQAKCTKNPTTSRVEFVVKTEALCEWVGIVRRQNDGTAQLFHPDGVTLLRRKL